jgi:hypothetical protein
MKSLPENKRQIPWRERRPGDSMPRLAYIPYIESIFDNFMYGPMAGIRTDDLIISGK